MKYIAIAFIITAAVVIYAVNRAYGEEASFDYYLLALSWSPAFCETHSDSEECTKPRGFILHGLWPQYEDGGHPENCDRSFVPDDVIDDMMDVMPNRRLVIHEWHTHGSCSGMDPATYFKKAKSIFNSITIPDFFTNIRGGYTTNRNGIVNVFTSENLGLKASSIQVVCQENRLSEVRICMDKQGNSRSCGDFGGTCQARQIEISSPTP